MTMKIARDDVPRNSGGVGSPSDPEFCLIKTDQSGLKLRLNLKKEDRARGSKIARDGGLIVIVLILDRTWPGKARDMRS
jgi:hypothetical protein